MYLAKNSPFNDYNISSPRNQPLQTLSSPRNPSDSYFLSSQARPNKKEFGMYSKRYLPREGAISRSRVTQQANMSTSGWGIGV